MTDDKTSPPPRDIRPGKRQTKVHAAQARRVRAVLAERFPLCFAPKGAPGKRPLKIGIGLDVALALPELSRHSIAVALEDYTWGPTYLAGMTTGAERIDLDGAPCGEVSETEAHHARARLAMFDHAEKQRSAETKTQAEGAGA